MNSSEMSKKKAFVADGVFKCEIHQFFARALVGSGYSGLILTKSPQNLTIIVKVVNRASAIGPEGLKANEYEELLAKRYQFPSGYVVLKFDMVLNKSLSANAQCELLKAKVMQKAPLRSAAMFIIRSVMRIKDVKGCEVIISGKTRQQRAKVQKYKSGYLISTGQPKHDYIDEAIKYVIFPQGCLGLKVKIMLPYDITGKQGCSKQLPDKISIKMPQTETSNTFLPTEQQ